MADPAPRIQLLRLPQLVYWKIVKSFCLFEQYNLAQLSKRSQYLIKAINRREKIDVHFKFRGDSTVRVENNKSGKVINSMKEYYENEKLKESFKTELESIVHVKKCIHLLNDTFNLTPVTLKFTDCCPTYYHIVPFLKQNGLRIGKISVFGIRIQPPNHETFKMIMAECGDVREVGITMGNSPNFRIDTPPVFQCDHLSLDEARWITVDHLINYFMDCKSLVLGFTKIFLKNLRPFIMKWLESCRMEHLCMSTKYAPHSSLREILRGLEAQQVKEATVYNMTFKFHRDLCFLIRDVNGKEAIVYNDRGEIRLETQAVVTKRW